MKNVKKFTTLFVVLSLFVNLMISIPAANADELSIYDYSSFIGTWNTADGVTLSILNVQDGNMTFYIPDFFPSEFTYPIINNQVQWTTHDTGYDFNYTMTFYDDSIYLTCNGIFNAPTDRFKDNGPIYNEFWFTSNNAIPRRTETEIQTANTDHHDYSKILNGDLSEFVGVWTNAEGSIINLKADGTEGETTTKASNGKTYRQIAEGFEKQESGVYTWGVRFDFTDEENGSYAIWLYPIGVNVTTNGQTVESDISQVRLYAGHDLSSVDAMRDRIYYFQSSNDSTPQSFWDVSKEHWAYNYIEELADRGVLSGYEDGSFQPDNTVTRAEWAKMFVLAFDLPISEFWGISVDLGTNMDVTDWYAEYMYTAEPYFNAEHIDTGDQPIVWYEPEEGATREDVTVSVAKLGETAGYRIPNEFTLSFDDVDTISPENQKYVAAAVNYGVIAGFEDNTFRGQDTLTRAEAAAILCRAISIAEA